MSVTVIVTNYARPENIETVLSAWLAQSVVPHIILVDAPKDESCRLSKLDYSMADEVVALSNNVGCFTRYLIAPMINTDFAAIVDDDYVPGEKCLEHYLKTARSMNRRFACLGEVGRHIPANLKYSARDVIQSDVPKRVDVVCRFYLFNQYHLPLIDANRRALFGNEFPRHDDIVCQSIIQRQTGLSSYVVPLAGDDEKAVLRELDDADSVSSKPDHISSRIETIRHLTERGWRPQSLEKKCRSCG